MSNEREMGELVARVQALEDDMKEFGQDVKAIRSILDQAKGGWRMMITVAGLSGAVGAMAVKALPWIAMGPK